MADCMTVKETAGLLREWDGILVLSHASPDGDTLGSASALLRGLTRMGKRVGFACADPVPAKFNYLFEGIPLSEKPPEKIVSVDVADRALLGNNDGLYGGRIDLAIDHHGTHVPFASSRWVDPTAAAAVELIYLLLLELGIRPDKATASCLYTGLTTDTGCFRYRSTTPRTHRIAAELMELGAEAADINRAMFETKSRQLVEAERRVLEEMRFYCENRCAVVQVPRSMLEETGVAESDLDGIASLPRQIEGVLCGVTLKEKEDGQIKASVRTNPPLDASVLCGRFGGGGHKAAAGCSFRKQSLAQAETAVVAECGRYLQELGL